jgi:predicted Zn-dependent peptidase
VLLGAAPSAPTSLALEVGARALAQSRLSRQLRDGVGLVDDVEVRPAPGGFAISLTASPRNALPAAEAARKLLADLAGSGLTGEEVRAAKETLAGTRAVALSTLPGLAARACELAWRGEPASHLDDQGDRIAATTRREVNEALKAQLAGPLVTVVAGPVGPGP